MGKEITYCNKCGTRLLESDFKKGGAVNILGKDFCKNCMGEEIKKIKAKGVTLNSTNAPAPTKNPSTVKTTKPDKSVKSRTGPIKMTDTRSIPKATKSGILPSDPTTRMMLLIGGIVMLVAIILLIVVLSRSGPPG